MNSSVKKRIPLRELPREFASLHAKHGTVLFRADSYSLRINRFRTKSNVADIDGLLYFFGNTYEKINPYRQVHNINDLIKFVNFIDSTMSALIKGNLTDITYVCISDIMNNGIAAEKILTIKDVAYPDYTVELVDGADIELDIDDEHSIISTTSKLNVNKVNSFDLKKLFKAEYLNSLYLVKIAHNRELDIRGIVGLLPQLQRKKVLDIVSMADSKDAISVCLHIPQDMISKVFEYKLKKRTTKVRLEDLTKLYISETVKG